MFMLLAGVIIISASGLLYLRHCEWCPEAAARYATEKAEKKSVGMCALYVRNAIIAGGIPLYVGGDAWSYKYTLPILNFHQVGKKVRARGRGYSSLSTYWWPQIWAYRYMEWQAVGFGLQTTKPYSPQRLPQSGV